MSTATARPLGLDDAVRTVLGEGARLREAQTDALAGLAEADTLLVARSGAGKTAVYAVATLMSDRLTVVVSPLLALQRDQLDSLRGSGLRAAAVSSAVTPKRQREALADAVEGRLDVLLLAPEQLVRPAVADELARARVGLVVVDEAHCVSEWGHDFRPDYLHVGSAVERLGGPRVLAVTATASAQVREEVVDRLRLRSPRVLVHDADRPNIWLGARASASDAERDAAVVEAAVATDGAGIVYARTHRHVEELAAALAEAGRPALVYHAGLAGKARAEAQDQFLRGDADLVVATSAFGMGVDRPDVRFVLHSGPPTSLDAYYQEVGRAGRDEEPALAVLFYRPDDFGLNHYLRSGGGSRPETLRAVLSAVRDRPGTREELAERTGVAPRSLSRALGALVRAGAVEEHDGVLHPEEREGRQRAVNRVLADIAAEREHAQAMDRSRVELVRTYADTGDCRRRLLLELLGEVHPERCGACDSCDAGTSVDVDDAPLHAGEQVEHTRWGPGTVSVVEADKVTVLFEERGYVTLDTAIALDGGLLTPVGEA
ncbi:RecQ family ATP-dependent DNA helicase [Cellulomonas aerilata]|uniref:ATP-dependent DNA helicase RecQ n=1 Tax=Cellulomonas aerilata TaxID=515326 RepID=A0A512DAT9_9CELL|nr:RecQ family ATP-dependent DNA helicase [Cellulomonas aerilata]GEO33565.1 ATP-dependent DNA helicase RecQ [Cellulomonas aerilata]